MLNFMDETRKIEIHWTEFKYSPRLIWQLWFWHRLSLISTYPNQSFEIGSDHGDYHYIPWFETEFWVWRWPSLTNHKWNDCAIIAIWNHQQTTHNGVNATQWRIVDHLFLFVSFSEFQSLKTANYITKQRLKVLLTYTDKNESWSW